MNKKTQFVQGLIVLMTALAQADGRAGDSLEVWFARDYANQITNPDLVALGLTTADVLSMITIAEQFGVWVAAEGRGGVLARYRSDV